MANGRKRLPLLLGGSSTPVATTSVTGTGKLSHTSATPSDPVVVETGDTRMPPTPSVAGKIPVDTGSAYGVITPGVAGTILTSTGTSSAPTFQAAAAGGYSGFRNLIINGNGQISQRRAGAGLVANGYGPDRWLLTLGTGAGATLVRTAEIGVIGVGSPNQDERYYIEISRTTAGSSATLLEQRIENVRQLSGQSVTLSFLAQSSDGCTPTIIVHQNFGAGGSPSATVDTTVVTSQALTTTWARYSFTFTLPLIEGKTVGTTEGTSYIGLEFQISSAQAGTRTLDLREVQFEGSASRTPYERVPYEVQLMRCQRFHWNTFGTDVAEAQNAGLNGSFQACAVGVANNTLTVPALYPVEMRAAPTVTFYNPSAAAATWFNATASIAATAVNISTRQATLQANAAPTAARVYNVHASFDAEL